ncbi:hypothetical protein [Rhodococcoides yunnanense]|uniref:hypothetical protein n=1 Tax=Rhodococcoides yunnanense TaxID=278209 RepID=UPI0009356231|nr:hypothetical protein [Rhodococcus yunnanensis]
MKQNVNHVDHVVWVAHLDSQAAHADKLGALAGQSLEGPFDRTDLGVRIYMSWETGLEILSPLPNYDSDFNRMLVAALAERGEGVLAVVFGVPDLEEARERARLAGYSPGDPIATAGDAPWDRKTSKFAESFVGDFLGSYFIYGEIAYAPGIVASV